MNRLKSSMLIVFAAAMILSFAFVPAEIATAQSESAALSIAPRKNYTIEPGDEINDTLLIRNIDREGTLNLSLRVVDFTYNDDGGTPKLILDETAANTPWSLKPFLTMPQTVTIGPGESESVDMNIAIPKDQGAGTYYSAIIYSSTASDGGNVGLSASGVTLVFTSVPGDVNEKLVLEKLGAYSSKSEKGENASTKGKYKLLNIDMPKRIGYTLKNEGNVAEAPVGSITLKNLIGKEIVINDINPNKSLALIGQTRTFETCIKLAKQEVDFNGSRQEASTCSDETGLLPGIYRVQLNGYYGWNGNNTQDIIGKTWMIYTPWWFLAIIFVILAFVVWQGWKFKRFMDVKRGRVSNTGGKKYIARGRK